mmetsp:Transcript_37663/g.60435  ORF Transcript_37663/g.60435 Transcript_37663/m.60435 type:complete len:121 (-) Transcript_37663:130-492(-)
MDFHTLLLVLNSVDTKENSQSLLLLSFTSMDGLDGLDVSTFEETGTKKLSLRKPKLFLTWVACLKLCLGVLLGQLKHGRSKFFSINNYLQMLVFMFLITFIRAKNGDLTAKASDVTVSAK